MCFSVCEYAPWRRPATPQESPTQCTMATQDKRSRFAATVFVRSKPVNWVRILPQMFMFLTDRLKTDILHILVRTHLLVLTCKHSCMLLFIIDQVCWKRSRSILILVWVRGPGRCCNMVENMLIFFFEGQPPGNFVWKPHPFREISVLRKGGGQAGGGCVEKNSPANHIDCNQPCLQ